MIKCAIVGATGLVGSMFLRVLEEKKLPIDKYVLFASKKSSGKIVKFMDKNYEVKELTKTSFEDERFDFALFSAGSKISEEYALEAVKNGCIVIDNSSYFRMNENVPLVVPEVNYDMIFKHKGIIANPNCSTIQAVVILKPLHDNYKLKRVVYSTYQAVSGAGILGLEDLKNTSLNKKPKKFDYPIYNNCLPQIDEFLENGYTKEEEKMINETRKILNLPNLNVTATAVRVPVSNSHGESINIEFENGFDIISLKKILANSKSIAVLDDIYKKIYPLNTFATGKDDVFVGRIRRDFSVKSGINLWCVADNIRKGAASNAVQILEILVNKKLNNI
mgnify:CR=1 FL=1